VSTPFEPDELRLSSSGKLFHSMQSSVRPRRTTREETETTRDTDTGRQEATAQSGPRREPFGAFSESFPRLMGLIESNTAQSLLERLEGNEEASSGFELRWEEKTILIQALPGEQPGGLLA